MKEYKKKADLNTKAGKYFIAKKRGMNKKNAAIAAGYNPTHTTAIEQTKTYQEIEKKYKDVLLEKITMDEIASAHADNITQAGATSVDRGARNVAIKMAKDWIEPDDTAGDSDDKILVVLRG